MRLSSTPCALGLISFAVLYFGRELLDLSAGPPPGTGPRSWVDYRSPTVAGDAERGAVLFARAPGPGHSLSLRPFEARESGVGHRCRPPSAVARWRLRYRCSRYSTSCRVILLSRCTARPRRYAAAVAAFAVAVSYGGLHSVQLMLGFAIVMLTLAMRRSAFGTSIRWGGAVAAAAASLGGYPWVIGSSASLALQAAPSSSGSRNNGTQRPCGTTGPSVAMAPTARCVKRIPAREGRIEHNRHVLEARPARSSSRTARTITS